MKFRKEAEQFIEDALDEAEARRSKEHPDKFFGGTIGANVSYTLKQVLIEKIEILMTEHYYNNLAVNLTPELLRDGLRIIKKLANIRNELPADSFIEEALIKWIQLINESRQNENYYDSSGEDL